MGQSDISKTIDMYIFPWQGYKFLPSNMTNNVNNFSRWLESYQEQYQSKKYGKRSLNSSMSAIQKNNQWSHHSRLLCFQSYKKWRKSHVKCLTNTLALSIVWCIVDLVTCNCHRLQVLGVPCQHVSKVLREKSIKRALWCIPSFLKLQQKYAKFSNHQKINLIQQMYTINNIVVKPPRQPGQRRRHSTRVLIVTVKDEYEVQTVWQHNRRTCKELASLFIPLLVSTI